LQVMALTGGPYTLPAGFYWVAVVSNGTTQPGWARTGSGNASVMNGGLTSASYRGATANVGQTTLPGTLAALTSSSSILFAALS
jgi:hypothetical protein